MISVKTKAYFFAAEPFEWSKTEVPSSDTKSIINYASAHRFPVIAYTSPRKGPLAVVPLGGC